MKSLGTPPRWPPRRSRRRRLRPFRVEAEDATVSTEDAAPVTGEVAPVTGEVAPVTDEVIAPVGSDRTGNCRGR